MAFCKACGQELGGAAFCPKCGASQGAVSAPAGSAASVATTSSDSPTAGLEENIAGLLCYLFHWLSGLIFLLIDKRPFVRFHGAQAIAFDLAVACLAIAFGIAMAIFSWLSILIHLPFLLFLVFPLWFLFGIAIFGAWIFCMYKAYQHEKFKLPIIGNIVEKMVGA